jgi:Fungal specific transcription factor domain
MHHFSTIVYQTLSEETVVQDLWQHDVPKEALQHTHLMHAILALSALHLQCNSDDEQQTAKYRESAIQHYDLALSQLKLLVVEIDKANCGSVLSAATLLGFFSSVYNRFEEDASRVLTDLWFNHQLLRGIPTIMEHTAPYFGEIKMSAIFTPKPWDHVPVPAGFQHGMDILRVNISVFGGGDESQNEIYLSAVQKLTENVKAEIANPQHITISYMFLPAADRKYMALVAARDQMALVIVAHYAIILHRQRHRWWMGDNGVRLFGAVKGLLDPGFRALVEWPEQFLLEHAGTQQSEALLYYS